MTHPKGQEIARRLASRVDILVENFKPGTMEKWGMGYPDLKASNRGLIMVRVSGYGQTGPYASRPGYANVAEGFGGIRYTSGYPDRPPVRTGTSLGDNLAGMHGTVVEEIVSSAEPDQVAYLQAHDEWVVVLEGLSTADRIVLSPAPDLAAGDRVRERP